MLVPIPNAFTIINTVALEGRPFPFSVSKGETEWGTTLHLTALRLADVADLLGRWLRPHVLVSNASHHVFETPDSDVFVSLSELARRSGVDRVEFDVGWSRYQRVDSAMEAIEVTSSTLSQLAANDFYDIELIDSEVAWDHTRVDEVMLALGTSVGDSVLGELDRSSTRFSGHDDCYVLIETRSAELADAVLGRTIAIFAGTMLSNAGRTPEVVEPDAAVLRSLFAKSPDWTAHPSNTAVSGDTVDLSLAAVPWRVGEFPTGRVDGVLSYRLESGQWHVSV
jgi:hypothetical protein